MLVYLLGAVLLFSLFYATNPFAFSLWTKSCFVKDGAFYYILVDGLLLLHASAALYFLITAQPPTSRKSSVNTVLQHMATLKFYILVFFCSNVWGMLFQIYPHRVLRMIFTIAISLHPGIATLPWLVAYFRPKMK